jgi:hypothetical protein
MVEHGFDLATAARLIGVEGRLVERMHRLSQLHPDVLAAMEVSGMPGNRELALIANAPQEVQAEALLRGSDRGGVNWGQIANLCRLDRIPKARAIFDADAEGTGIAWEQDLFTQPGSEEEWTTTNTARFCELQAEALRARVEKEAEEGSVEFVPFNRSTGGATIPPGYQRAHKHDDMKPLSKKGKFRRLWYVCTEGWQVGHVNCLLVEKEPKAEKRAEAEEEGHAAPKRTRDLTPLTKAGQGLVAQAKTRAIRAHLQERVAKSWTAEQAAGALLLALTAPNVEVRGDPENKFQTVNLSDLRERILDEQGRLLPEEIPAAAADALSRILFEAKPDSFRLGSGEALTLIGRLTGADAALPRFDTPEVLATVNPPELRRLAAEAGIVGVEKVSGLRAALVGKLPNWRPARFGEEPAPVLEEAPTPEPAPKGASKVARRPRK